jgi:Fe-S-cluster containining protein
MKKDLARSARANKPGRAESFSVAGVDLEARRAQRLHTVAVLKSGRTPLQIVDIGVYAVEYADNAVAAEAKHRPPRAPLACASGCAWCCHQRVGVAAPEVVRIVSYLRDARTQQEMDSTIERIQAVRKARSTAHRFSDGTPCPLLVDNRCSVYPVRPLTCRGFNSSDPQACQAAVTDSKRTEVPVYAPQLRLTSMVLDGMRAGLKEAGLESELLELTAALHIALTVPDAVTDWLKGEPVFASARLS